MIKALFQLVFGALCVVIALGLVLALAFWAMANIWMLLSIFAVILVLLIIWGMMTCDNEWISIPTRIAVAAPIIYVLYLIANP